MANNIGWGQAHANNDIGYGQGGVNNTIDWAKMYKRSNSGETVLSPEFDPIQILTDDFEARVLADSGTFEAKQCLIDILNEINNI